ncbi:MAG: hypothetical protein R3A46_01760 [Thermomicrobiales bacterium]
MGYGSVPGDSPLVAVLVVVAPVWIVVSRLVAGIDADSDRLPGRWLVRWKTLPQPVRSKLSMGSVLFAVGAAGLIGLQRNGTDPLSGDVMLSMLALAAGIAQIVSGVLAVD